MLPQEGGSSSGSASWGVENVFKGIFLNDGSHLPTRFPLQLVNPSRERLAAHDLLTLCFNTGEERREWILQFKAHLRGLASGVPKWMKALLSPSIKSPSPSLPSTPPSIYPDQPFEPFVRLLYLGDTDFFSPSLISADVNPEEAGEGGDYSSYVTVTTVSEKKEGDGIKWALARSLLKQSSHDKSFAVSTASARVQERSNQNEKIRQYFRTATKKIGPSNLTNA